VRKEEKRERKRIRKLLKNSQGRSLTPRVAPTVDA